MSQTAPANSFLPNSSSYMFEPVTVNGDVFQVKWMGDLNMHGLFLTRKGVTSLVAAHHNGHSCFQLIRLIVEGDADGIIAQMEYIQRCGGLTTNPENFVAGLNISLDF